MTAAEDLLGELAVLAESIGPALEPEGTARLLEALTETARRLFGARACSLAMLSEDESELVYTNAAGEGADDVTGLRMPSTRGVAGWVVASGQPVIISDLRHDVRFARDVAEQTGYVPQALLAVPVESSQRLLGVLTLLDRDSGRPAAEEDVELLALFADQAAIALEGARAFTDFGRVVLRALAAAARTGSPLQQAIEATSAELDSPDQELSELAGVFAELTRQGPEATALAVRLVREVLAFTKEGSERPR